MVHTSMADLEDKEPQELVAIAEEVAKFYGTQ